MGVNSLRPGEINQIPFFFSAGSSVNVNMLRYTEDSSTPITEADWNMIETAIKPSEIADQDWNSFWSSIQPRIGKTWGDYVQVVNDLAKAFSPEAERDYDVRELFAQWYESGDLSVYTPKSSVSVQLIDRELNIPVSNVKLTFFEYINEEEIRSSYQIITDEQGRFEISSIPTGNYTIVLENGYTFTNVDNETLSSGSGSRNITHNIQISEDLEDVNLELSISSSPEAFSFDPNDYGEEYVNSLNQLNEVAPQDVVDELTSSSDKSSQSEAFGQKLLVESPNSLSMSANSFVLSATEDPDDGDPDDGDPDEEESPIKLPPPDKGGKIVLPTPFGNLEFGESRLFEKKDCEGAEVADKFSLSLKSEFLKYEPAAIQLEPSGSLQIKSNYDLNKTIREYEHEKTTFDVNVDASLVSYNPLITMLWLAEQYFPQASNIIQWVKELVEQLPEEYENLVDAKFGGGLGIQGKAIFFERPNLGIGGSVSGRMLLQGGFKFNYNEIISIDIKTNLAWNTQIFPYPFPPTASGSLTLSVKTPLFAIPEVTFSVLDVGLKPPLGSFFDPEDVEFVKPLVDIYKRNLSDPSVPEECFDDEHDDGDLDDYNPAVLVSRDPNDILGPEGFGEQQWINADNPLDYTIRFENDPKLASAPAQVVRITQQLDSDLDFRTFRVGDFGFGDTFIDVPDNRAFYQTRLDLVAEKGIYVDVFAGIDIATGEAFWELRSIDPATGEQPSDPLLGFLPPNLTKPEGDGFVSYTIRTDRDIETGAVIDAEATIVFDINEPIDTPAIFNTIDVGKPTSTVNALPKTNDNEEFTVSWSGNDDKDGSAIADYTIYVAKNGGEFTPWLEGTALTEAIFTGTPGSSYEFYAVARDNAGNVQDIPTTAQASTVIAGGNNPPVLLSPIGTQIVTEDSNFSLNIFEEIFIDTDEEEVLTYTATLTDGSELPNWLTFDTETLTFSGTPTNEDLGNLNIIVTVTDKLGETVSDTFELIVENVNDAPTVKSAIANQIATEDKAFNFTFPVDTFNDVDAGDKLTYAATLGDGSELPNWLIFNAETRTFSGTAINENVGTLSIQVTATDNDGEVATDTFELEVVNVNDVPTLDTAITNQTATEDEAFNFTFSEDTFNDVDARDSLIYSATLADGSELPSWLTFDSETRTFSGTPVNEDVGTLNVLVTATDNNGESVSNTFELEVANVNDAPIVESAIANQVATEDEAFSFTFNENTFNNVDTGDNLTYSATLADGSELPSWLTFDADTRTFSGTPINDNLGTLSVLVTATDNDGESVSNTFELEVINVNDAPTIKSAIANQTAAEDEEFSFTFDEDTFNDVDAGDSLTYTATDSDNNQLPNWLTFNGETKTFSGIPVNENVGNLSILVRATDNYGEVATNTFELEIINVNDTPTVKKAIANQAATEDEQFSFTFSENTFNDVDAGDSLTYIATEDDGSELPSWLTFDADTRTFSGIPVNEDVSTLSIKVTATDNDGESVSDTFELEVINVNDTPLNINLSNLYIDENSSNGTIIGSLSTLDPDLGDSFSYTLLNNADGRFILNNNNLQVAAGNLLDFETNSSHQIEIQTTDTEGLFITKNFTISLNDLNEAPITINDRVTANYSNAKIISIESLLSNDRDPEGNPLSLIFIGNAAGGTISLDDDSIIFTSNGTSNIGNFEYSVSDGVFTSTAAVAIDVGVTEIGGKRSDTLVGTPGDDLIHGDSGNDTLNGGNGNDTLDGGRDNDLLLGGEGTDYLIGNSGLDTLDGGNGGDIYFADHNELDIYSDTGNYGVDVIKATGRKDFDLQLGLTFNGGLGRDTLDGGQDNDYLYGGLGEDTLFGGKGKDSFVFNSPNEGIDTITDFSVKDDTLVFSAAGFSGNLTVEMVKGEMFVLSTAATSNEHRFIYDAGSGDFFYDSDGTGENEQIKIAQLDSGLSLGSDDLFFGS